MNKTVIVKSTKKSINHTDEILKDIRNALNRIVEELIVMNEHHMNKEDLYG